MMTMTVTSLGPLSAGGGGGGGGGGGDAAHRVLVTSGFLLFSSTVVLFCVRRKRERHRQWRQRVTYKKLSKTSDLGQCFGLDIGGTLAKIVFFEQKDAGDHRKRPRSPSHDLAVGEMTRILQQNEVLGRTGVHDVRLRIHSKQLGGFLHFVRFESSKTREAIEFIANTGINQSLRSLPCTGGGAHKYAPLFAEMAAIDLDKYDEMDCTILGLNLLLTTLPDEVYTFEDVDASSLSASRMKIIKYDVDEDIYPYLMVSIGSGVSVLYVRGPNDYKRVSGSSIGGGTYWGLCRLLTACQSFDEALDLCVHGSNQSVDMLVGDIYGGAYDKFGLPATTVASSFGKMMTRPRESVSDADVARALLVMVTQNIGQVAFLNSCLHQTKHIFFVGNFLRHNRISARMLAYAINFWSKGTTQARFCKHEGYLGALGAFLRNAEATNAHGEQFFRQQATPTGRQL